MDDLKSILENLITPGKVIGKVMNAVSELKEMNSVLTEIGKTSDQTAKSLKQLGDDSFEIASKYGRNATDYLTSVQKMNQNGFHKEQGNSLAEQSLLAQAAGNIACEIADTWILATNAAYDYEGEAQKINDVLDGTSNITKRNRLNMTDMAEAMSSVSNSAALAGIAVNELSAMLGTSLAATKQRGDEIGAAWKTILANLQDDSSLEITNTLNKANASMTETYHGVKQLREPLEILKDLAKTYNSLGESNPLKTEIATNIGGKEYANILSAFLSNYSQYETMLADYAQGTGSAMEAATQSADNLEGSLNRLSNTWTETIGNIADSDLVTNSINALNILLGGVEKLTETFGTLTTVSTLSLTHLNQKNGGGLIRLFSLINNSPFLATVEFNSDVYDSYLLS